MDDHTDGDRLRYRIVFVSRAPFTSSRQLRRGISDAQLDQLPVTPSCNDWIRSTLRTAYNLRAFPFDEQYLTLEISDDEYIATEWRTVIHRMSSWKLEADPVFHHEVKAFRWETGAPSYDNATVQFVVRRHVTF